MCHMTFSKKVLDLTSKIPKGKVTTYSEIARALCCPKASRAVGNALNKNRHLVTIPCHRVIKSTGEIGGYSGGQDKKIAILKKEGIPITAGRITDLEKYLHKFKKIIRKQASPRSS